MYFLIYVSIARNALRSEELLELLRVSRENNMRDGITGLLLYKDGKFMQLLEGPEATVCATYSRIEKDRRHHDVTILLQDESPSVISPIGRWGSTISAATSHARPLASPIS